MKLSLFALVVLSLFSLKAMEGPGLVQQTYTKDELFKIMSSFESSKPGVRGHAAMIMFKGYLAMVEAMDSGKGDAAFVFYDISDPKKPKRVALYADENTKELFEGHNYAFTVIGDRDIVFLIAKTGLQIWDWTNIHQPTMLSKLNMPLLSGGAYDRTAWWLAAQYPKLYLGGTNTGLYIIDAKDLKNPKVDKRISINKLGGFKVGSVFACGNQLIANTFDGPGISLFDISDPLNPQLQSTIKESFGYTTLYNGRYIYGIGEKPKIWDIQDPKKPVLISKYTGPKMGSKGGYAVFQDGFLHQGVSSTYTKLDVRDPKNPKIVGQQSKVIKKKDWDGAHMVGNITIIACDHGTGSHLVAHQEKPDLKGPEVNFVSPVNLARNVAISSRVGLSFSDEIDHRSITEKSFIFRELGGEKVKGFWSCNNSLLNFSPAKPLKLNTTYEIILKAGGVKDQVDNAIEEEFRSVFSTGAKVSAFKVDLVPLEAALVKQELTFKVKNPQAGVEYAWDFDDGSPLSEYSESVEVRHEFSRAGRFQVVLFARKDGQTASTSQIQIVTHPTVDQAPVNSSSLIYDREYGRTWNVNPDNNTLTVLDTKKLKKLIELPTGEKPRSLALVGTEVWVVNEIGSSVSRYDRAGLKILGTFDLAYASQAYGIVAAGSDVYISTQGTGEVLHYSGTSQRLLARLKLEGKIRGLAINADKLYATRFISPDEEGQVFEIDRNSISINKTISLAIDPGPDTEDKGRGLPNYLSQIVISPDALSAWVPSKKDNIQRGLQRDGQALTFENSVRSIISKINLIKGEEELLQRHDFNDRDMANAACFSPRGDLLFVASQGSNSVEVLDANSSIVLSSILRTGSAPQALLVDDLGRLYVHNYLSRSLSVYDINNLLEAKGVLEHQVADIKLVSQELLAPAILRGKQTFHFAGGPRMSRDGYISCASCHLDGGQDGRVWDFTDRGEGLRNTISLNGRAGIGHGRLHWSANFDEIQDFEHDIRGPFGGEGLIKDTADHTLNHFHSSLGPQKAGMSQDLDELALYVTSLSQVPASPYRQQDGSMTGEAKAGEKIFNKLNCYECHGGSQFTDSESWYLHDVGTMSEASGKRLNENLPGLDTPTLKGLWATAPYLHDGSASTLREVLIDRNSEGKHGDIASLNESEISQLIAYLQQIDESSRNVSASTPGKASSGQSVYVKSFETTDNIRLVEFSLDKSVYNDADVFITKAASLFNDYQLLQTRLADKANHRDGSIKILLDGPSEIILAFPSPPKASKGQRPKRFRAPPWLKSWKKKNEVLQVGDQKFLLFSKNFSDPRVVLGKFIDKKFMYFGFIKKD